MLNGAFLSVLLLCLLSLFLHIIVIFILLSLTLLYWHKLKVLKVLPCSKAGNLYISEFNFSNKFLALSFLKMYGCNTNWARRSLTSEIGRDRVYSTWYGRKRELREDGRIMEKSKISKNCCIFRCKNIWKNEFFKKKKIFFDFFGRAPQNGDSPCPVSKWPTMNILKRARKLKIWGKNGR